MRYHAGKAIRSLLGNLPTTNPSIAAKSLLKDRRAVRYATRKMTRRRAHRGNPPIALVAALQKAVPLIGKLLKKPSEVRAAAIAPQLVAQANSGNLTAAKGLLDRSRIPMKVAEALVWQAAAAQLAPAIVSAVGREAARIPLASQKNPEEFAASILASPVQVSGGGSGIPPAAGSPASTDPTSILGGLAVPIVRELAKPARRSTARRGRYPTYVDRQGRQRYSTKPPGTELRIPQGASPTPGSPYSFFRGAVGKGGAAATAGQVAIAGAAGIGAYLVTQKLLQYLGGRAQAREEAGVNAALALREARAELAQQLGRQPTAAELRPMSDAYKAKLLELGYDPVTFTRTRSKLDTFLEDYNPFN